MLNDPALTVDERAVFLTRYVDARDETAQHRIGHLTRQLEALHRQQQMQPVPPTGHHAMPPMPGYAPMYAPYGLGQPQPFSGPPTMSSLVSTMESPLTTVFNSVNLAFRGVVYAGSWYLIFLVLRLVYRFMV